MNKCNDCNNVGTEDVQMPGYDKIKICKKCKEKYYRVNQYHVGYRRKHRNIFR